MSDRYTEIQEAIYAGENALASLEDAYQLLDKAGTWGIFDMFGGNLFTGIMKHSRIEEARRCIDQAQYNIQRFQRELQDVRQFNIYVDIDNFITFADFFFDGFLADIFVQSKIRDAQRQIQDAMVEINNILRQLRSNL